MQKPTETAMETTNDTLLGGQVRFCQPKTGYRAAIDPVFLAASVAAKGGHKVADLGCGAGAAMLCLASRVEGLQIDGLEIQASMVSLASENIMANGLQDRVRVTQGDLLDPPADLTPGSFDWVMANPPYLPETRGNPPPDASKRIANMEGDADLGAWVGVAETLLKRKGTLCVVQRADRLSELLGAIEGGGAFVGEESFGDVRILPLWPHGGEAAGRVLVHARKGVKQPSTLLAGMVLHGPDGAYTPEAEAVLQGAALSLQP
ncbi:MAG: methyltransferase [Rhodospirillaceae bacterium]|nr:methyltransferase [Rhodospirillaceae bacterium]